MKKCKITIQNHQKEISPIPKNDVNDHSALVERNAANKKEKQKFDINMNVLKCKLYDLNIENPTSPEFGKSTSSPFEKSRNSLFFDPTMPRPQFCNSTSGTLKYVESKSGNYKKVMRQTVKNLEAYGVNLGSDCNTSVSDKNLVNSSKE